MLIQAPEVRYARYSDGAIAGACAAVAVAFASTELINYAAPLSEPLTTHLKYWVHGLLHLAHYDTDTWRMYSNYLGQVATSNSPYIIKWRMCAVGAATAAAGVATAWTAGKPISDMTKVSGNDLLRDKQAIKYYNSLSERNGLKLANGLHFDLNKETEHFLISGGTGAGKSVTAMTILKPVLERRDRVIIVNYKGLTEKFPVTLNTESKHYDAIILNPADKRSEVWAYWEDITTKSHAREWSARIITESKEPVWSNAARFIMTGILMCLINTRIKRGLKCSWNMLRELCIKDRVALVEILETHYPEGLRSIKEEGKTSESVLMNFAAFVAPIIDLADAWSDRTDGFSVEKWVTNPDSQIRTVILQISSEFKLLSQVFNQSILNQVGTYLTRLDDVSANKNKLWIYADEFPRLGNAEVFEELFSVGRSKGMRVMIAIQSIGQLKKEYGIDIAEGWIDSIGTKIMGRQDGTGAKWLSDMCGEAVYTQLTNGRTEDNGRGRQRVTYSAPQSYSVFPPQLAQNELGIVKQRWFEKILERKPKGVRMLIHGTQGADLIVNFPFTPLPTLRKEMILADVFKGGFGFAETVDLESLMTVNNGVAALEQSNSLTAKSTELVELKVTENLINTIAQTQNEVFATVETLDNEVYATSKTQDDDFLDELTKEVGGEVLDEITDSHLSVALEVIDAVSYMINSEHNQEVNDSPIINTVQKKKKRYLSRKSLQEQQF